MKKDKSTGKYIPKKKMKVNKKQIGWPGTRAAERNGDGWVCPNQDDAIHVAQFVCKVLTKRENGTVLSFEELGPMPLIVSLILLIARNFEEGRAKGETLIAEDYKWRMAATGLDGERLNANELETKLCIEEYFRDLMRTQPGYIRISGLPDGAIAAIKEFLVKKKNEI